MTQSVTLQSFWQTLSAEFSDPMKVFPETYALSKAVYKDFAPVEKQPGLAQTITIAYPDEVTAVDGQGADPTINEASFSSKSVVFDQNPQYAFVVRDFDQFNSPQRVRDIIVDPAVKAIRKSINDKLWTKAATTSGLFTSYTGISTTGSKITPAEFLSQLEKLAENNVPVQDRGNVTLCVHPKVYYGILGDSNWSDFQVAGNLANDVRQTGEIPTVYGINIAMDQGASVSGTPSTRTFTNLMLHRYGMALVTRPLPSPSDSNVVKVANVLVDGIPIQVMMGFSVQKKGYVVIVSAGYGVGVVRPIAGLVSTTTEA